MVNLWDPQGNLAQRIGDEPVPVNGPVDVTQWTGWGVSDTEVFDSFGDLRGRQVSTDPQVGIGINSQGYLYGGMGSANMLYGFGGQYGYYADPSGLDLMTHRFYDPTTGRFVNRDPIGYRGGMDLYGFVGNNPITGADPSGTDALIFWGTNHAGDHLHWYKAAKDIANDYDASARLAISSWANYGPLDQNTAPTLSKAYIIGSPADAGTGVTLDTIMSAFQQHKNIDTIIYVGHAGQSHNGGKLYFSPTLNFDEGDVDRLDTENVLPNANIELDGCHTADPGLISGESIAQAFANHFQTDVNAYEERTGTARRSESPLARFGCFPIGLERSAGNSITLRCLDRNLYSVRFPIWFALRLANDRSGHR